MTLTIHLVIPNQKTTKSLIQWWSNDFVIRWGIWLVFNMNYLIIKNIIYGYQILNIEKKVMEVLSPYSPAHV